MAKARAMSGLEAEAARLADQMGYELVDISLDREPSGKYLRFYIDREEGVSLDDCEAFHKAVRASTETVDYDFMEVSSPGIDRPLKKDRDFERNLGAEIEIRLYKPLNGNRQISGILAGLEGNDILLDTPEGRKSISRKDAALVRPIVDMEGIEEVDLSGDDGPDSDDEEYNTDEE